MPKPHAGESQKAFLDRCIPVLIAEGREQDQAVAICASMWSKKMEQDQLYELHGVEIFRAGTWNNDKYTVDDLDEMVVNFDKVGYQVPVKLGHAEDGGEPAYGWVSRVFRIGDKIVADLRDLPGKIYDAIRNRRFDHVSAEMFWDLKRNGETFRRALKAVALLGAETPAVAGLTPLRESLRGFADEAEWSAVRHYTLEQEKPVMSETKDFKATAKALGLAETATQDEIDAKIKELSENATKVAALTKQLEDATTSGVETKKLTEELDALRKQFAEVAEREHAATINSKVDAVKIPSLRDHFRSLYTLALAEGAPKTVKFSFKDGETVKERDDAPIKVLDDLVERMNKHVSKLFNEMSPHVERDENDVSEAPGEPGKELDRLVKLTQAANPKLGYTEAMTAVLADPKNADLAQAYARLG